jgi:hypothetical protein
MGKLFATTRQLTGTPMIHQAYVYDGNRVVMACKHQHGRNGRGGSGKPQRCANRMLDQYLKAEKLFRLPRR